MTSSGGAAPAFSWPSVIGLVYVALVTTYHAVSTSDGPAMIAGSALYNLGWVLIMAGVFAGSFRALHLTRRAHVLLAGVALLALGILLVQLEP